MQANEEEGILVGADDKRSATPGDNDPMFANFTQQSDININVGANEAGAPATWDDSWDFHLQAGSPALTGGKTDFTPNFATNGITMVGLEGFVSNNTFTSPAPSEFFGAFGQE